MVRRSGALLDDQTVHAAQAEVGRECEAHRAGAHDQYRSFDGRNGGHLHAMLPAQPIVRPAADTGNGAEFSCIRHRDKGLALPFLIR